MNISQLKTIASNILNELKEARSDKESSLAFIINQIPEKSIVQDKEIFQVLTIGGTLGNKALVKKDNGNLKILKKENFDLPVFGTKEDLLNCLGNLLDKSVKAVSINFAYPLKPVFERDKLDGILLRGTKEHQFKGLIGERVGQTFENYVKEKFNRNIQVYLANDTICLLLSGLTKNPWNNLASLVLGTGFNCAIFLEEKKLVNLEAGNFDKLPQSSTGKIIDDSSQAPGTMIFEKEVAGAYLYQHFNFVIKEKGLDYPIIYKTSKISEALNSPDYRVSEIAKNVLEHSAQYVSCMIAGILEYSQKDMIFVVEGNLFLKAPNYEECVQKYISELTDFKVKFIQVKNSNILGAARLVA